MADLTLDILGETAVQWTRPSPTIPYIRNYHKKQRLLHIQVDLMGTTGGQVELGAQETSFMFTLPEELPASFEGSCGYCRYWVQLEGKEQYWFKRKELAAFNVVTKLDLNQMPQFLTPTFHKLEKEFLVSGSVRMSVCTYVGFAPGQRVPCRLTISNENRAAISKLKVSLIQRITYTASSGYADEEKRICSAEKEKLERNKVEECNMDMVIPPCAPSTKSQAESLITIAYVMRVEMRFTYHLTLADDIPVTVASSPVLYCQLGLPK